MTVYKIKNIQTDATANLFEHQVFQPRHQVIDVMKEY